jgi:hypothetical protein
MPLLPTPNYKPFHFLQQEMHINIGDDDVDDDNYDEVERAYRPYSCCDSSCALL